MRRLEYIAAGLFALASIAFLIIYFTTTRATLNHAGGFGAEYTYLNVYEGVIIPIIFGITLISGTCRTVYSFFSKKQATVRQSFILDFWIVYLAGIVCGFIFYSAFEVFVKPFVFWGPVVLVALAYAGLGTLMRRSHKLYTLALCILAIVCFALHISINNTLTTNFITTIYSPLWIFIAHAIICGVLFQKSLSTKKGESHA